MPARHLIEALAPDQIRQRAAEVLRAVTPHLSAVERRDANQVKLWAKNDPATVELLGDDEDVEDQILAELERLIVTKEDAMFKRRATNFKRRTSTPSDPLAHITSHLRGLTWEEAKRLVWGTLSDSAQFGEISDRDIESAFETVYNAHRGATFSHEAEYLNSRRWRLSDADDTLAPEGDDYTARMSRMEKRMLLQHYFPDGVPATVTVYRGVPRPDVVIKAGDYCTLDRGVARAYLRGKHGVILTSQLPSRDLIVAKPDTGGTELVYWPEGSKPLDREAPPTTLRQEWERANT